MGLSIYDVNAWVEDTPYNINDIYEYPANSKNFYYAAVKHQSGSDFDEDFGSSFSDGITTVNGKSYPKFFWTPSYNSQLQVKPSVKSVQFGDGYSSNAPDGINNILLPFNLTFDKRDENETRAILHFLNQRAGAASFNFVPPFPYNSLNKLFLCKTWNFQTIFANNHTIQCEFMETPL